MFKKVTSIIYILTITLVVVIAIATILTVTKAPGGIRLFVVQSGSMEPTIKTGSVVIISPRDNYQKDDIITYFADPSKTNLRTPNSTVTHRIVDIKTEKESTLFQTRGDSNNSPDKDPVSPKSVLGKVVLSIPYVGRIIAFTKTQVGFLSLIVIPGTIIIYSELINIKSEVKRLLTSKSKKPPK